MKRYLILLVLFAAILAGCGPQTEELVPTALPASTDVPTDAPTVQLTSPPAATNTLMPRPPTRTPKPTLTATTRPPNEPEQAAILKCSGDCYVAFGSDSKTVALGDDTVQIWAIPEFELIHEIEFQDLDIEFHYYVENIIFSSDDSLLAVVFGKGGQKGVPESQLVVWDIATEQVVMSVALEKAYMAKSDDWPYEYTAQAMAFIPDSSRLIYANGNWVEIRDVLDAEKGPDVLDLGEDMFASQIEVREDGEFVCIFMDWEKDHVYRTLIRTKYHAQIWHVYSQTLRKDVPFPDMDLDEEGMFLVGSILLKWNVTNGTVEGKDLYTDIEYQFPYRRGTNTLSSDATRLVVFRSNWSIPEEEKGLEIWDTYHGKKLYDFLPAFQMDPFYFYYRARFSPNNKYLAMVFDDDKCYVWDLMPDIEASLYESN